MCGFLDVWVTVNKQRQTVAEISVGCGLVQTSGVKVTIVKMTIQTWKAKVTIVLITIHTWKVKVTTMQ